MANEVNPGMGGEDRPFVIADTGEVSTEALHQLFLSKAVSNMEVVIAERHSALLRRRVGRYVAFGLILVGYVITAAVAAANLVAAIDHRDQVVAIAGLVGSAVAAIAFISAMAGMLAARRRRRRELRALLEQYISLRQQVLEDGGAASEDPLPKEMFVRPQAA